MNYTNLQIQAAKDNAQMHGIKLSVSDSQAIDWLNWYFANRSEYVTATQAAMYCVAGLDKTGHETQIAKWQQILQR